MTLLETIEKTQSLLKTSPINVTKTFLPSLDEYNEYLKDIWSRSQITNHGPFVIELEDKLKKYLNVPNAYLVSNGTIALQLALEALNIKEGEIITTPFSYVATTSSILWQRCKPVFVDIDQDNFCIDSSKIEEAITPNTKAIMAVHVFGVLCDVEALENISKKYNIPIIYDAAHAFGVKYRGKSFAEFGDVVTCSFHATKLFHSCEGGSVTIKDQVVAQKFELIRSFGHVGDNHYCLGINGKMSELHAAMGLCNLKYIDMITQKRKFISELYNVLLGDSIERPTIPNELEYNYAYYPVLFTSEDQLVKVFDALKENNIFPRRYFYPSLNLLPYVGTKYHCEISEDISLRIACLPLHNDLQEGDVIRIVNIIKDNLS